MISTRTSDHPRDRKHGVDSRFRGNDGLRVQRQIFGMPSEGAVLSRPVNATRRPG